MNKFADFRGCWEACMDFDTAVGSVGWADKPAEQIEVLRNQWNRWNDILEQNSEFWRNQPELF